MIWRKIREKYFRNQWLWYSNPVTDNGNEFEMAHCISKLKIFPRYSQATMGIWKFYCTKTSSKQTHVQLLLESALLCLPDLCPAQAQPPCLVQAQPQPAAVMAHCRLYLLSKNWCLYTMSRCYVDNTIQPTQACAELWPRRLPPTISPW